MPDTIDFAIGDVKTTAFIARPKGSGPFAGIVVTFHREGLDPLTARLVDDVAAAGYAVIAPNHYHVMPPGTDIGRRREFLTDEQMTVDLRAAVDWLAADKDVDDSRLALLGECMGGRTTLMGLAALPDCWRCGCVWYGGNAFTTLGNVPPPADRLDAIRVPIAGYFGNEDTNPAPADVDELDRRLTALGKPHEFHRYDDTGHAFLVPGAPSYRERASRDSWAKALDFLGRYL